MEHLFTTVGERRTYPLPFRWRIPIRCRRDCAIVGGEADQNGRRAEMLACQLADVELAAMSHLRRACVADMGIVCPHDNLRLSMESFQV